jgi:ADP-ribose pyrophosphatase YjhB (NUDIX family)
MAAAARGPNRDAMGTTGDGDVNFDPQKLFIGLLDFFSILLPGALLTCLAMVVVGPIDLGPGFPKLDATSGWVAFLFASYLFGNLVFLLGSWLDELYDLLRRHTLNRQIFLLAHRSRLLPWPARALVWLVFKRERNLAVERASRIKHQALGPLDAHGAVNTFQWSKTLLNQESPASLSVVERFEAHSKFFRCFVVVLLFVLAAWPRLRLLPHWHWAWIPAILALLVLALWRYMEQRFKATNHAYWSVLTLAARGGKVQFSKPAPPAGDPAHTACVVFRRHFNWLEPWRTPVVQYLLVADRQDPARATLPAGRVEEGEHLREAAIREVHHQTSVWGRIVHVLGDEENFLDEVSGPVRVFFMQAAGRDLAKDASRDYEWLPLAKARECLQPFPAQAGALQAGDEWRRRSKI